MHRGSRVSLHGLQSRPELNGQPATLILWDVQRHVKTAAWRLRPTRPPARPASAGSRSGRPSALASSALLPTQVDAGRWSVQIEGSDERMRVKPSCIKLVSAKQLQELANEVFEAARSGHAGRLSKLLASSPAVAWGDISDGGTGTTVLAVAAKGGHAKCVALLLNCEGKPNIRAADSFGQAAVHCAAESGSAEALRLLLDAGADPCSPDGQGQTPLHFAAEEGRVECARMLLQAGASASAVYRGATPYQWAQNGGHTECSDLLKGLSGRPDHPAKHNPSTHTPVAVPPGTPGASPSRKRQQEMLPPAGCSPLKWKTGGASDAADRAGDVDGLHPTESDAEAQSALVSLMRGLQDGSLELPDDDLLAEIDGSGPDIPF